MNEPQIRDSAFLEKRRQLLKLGAAGVPMLLTMKASASSTVHSALDCLITVPDGLCILVGADGAAWISTSYDYDGQKLTNGKVSQFKSSAQFVLPSGSIPERYRPDGDCTCSSGGGDDDDDDDDGYHHGENGGTAGSYLAGVLDSIMLTRPAAADDRSPVLVASGWGDDDDDQGGNNDCESGGDDHDDDDDNDNQRYGGDRDDHDDDDDDDEGGGGGSDTAECQYKIYCYDQTQFAPGDFLNSNGEWNLSGDLGLYTIAVAKYGEYYGAYSNFPGVSCIMSILTYLNTR